MNQLKFNNFCLLIIAIYSLENVNKQPSKIKNKHQNSLFTISITFPGLESTLYAGEKLSLTAKFSRKLFLVAVCAIEKSDVSEAQSNRFIF